MTSTVGIGMFLTSEGAALALVAGDGGACSVAAVAEVTWPAGPGGPGGLERVGATAEAGRLLGTARRRLRVRRWSDVLVTGFLDDVTDPTMTGRVAGLLARAGFTLVGTVAVDEARGRGADGSLVRVPPELGERVQQEDAMPAVGAAVTLLVETGAVRPATDAPSWVGPARGPGGSSEAGEWGDAAESEGGWVVEHVYDHVDGQLDETPFEVTPAGLPGRSHRRP
jgi:hypothetical protein